VEFGWPIGMGSSLSAAVTVQDCVVGVRQHSVVTLDLTRLCKDVCQTGRYRSPERSTISYQEMF
jgi:hypothetical protein